jgi:hypothetical protein
MTRLGLLQRLALASITAAILGACSGGPSPSSVHPSLGSLAPRPSSPVIVRIVEPADGATVTGTTVHVVLELVGGSIVTETDIAIRPDQGHVHLYVNNALVSMNYGLEQDIPVEVGTLVLKAEFVAADHAPFNPRVWSAETIFTVN